MCSSSAGQPCNDRKPAPENAGSFHLTVDRPSHAVMHHPVHHAVTHHPMMHHVVVHHVVAHHHVMVMAHHHGLRFGGGYSRTEGGCQDGADGDEALNFCHVVFSLCRRSIRDEGAAGEDRYGGGQKEFQRAAQPAAQPRRSLRVHGSTGEASRTARHSAKGSDRRMTSITPWQTVADLSVAARLNRQTAATAWRRSALPWLRRLSRVSIERRLGPLERDRATRRNWATGRGGARPGVKSLGRLRPETGP